jgi:soluble P-type ATPase
MFMDMQKEVSRIVAERAAEKAAKIVEEAKSPLTPIKKVVMLGNLRQGSIK